MDKDLIYRTVRPDDLLVDFVESFWMIQNQSERSREVVVLPDGRIDLFFTKSAGVPFHSTLLGIDTTATWSTLAGQRLTFAISFKPLAAEYLFQPYRRGLLNHPQPLPSNFWEFSGNDLDHFDRFCQKAAEKITILLPKRIDPRKRKLFDLIYASDGQKSVKELSDQVGWSSRQISRYFHHQFGLSLKAYCNILRFRASFPHIKEGKLFPEQNFADQSHFIKEVKRMAGVSPKVLSKNQNDRFIQFSTLRKK